LAQRGRGVEFELKLPSGETLQIQVPNRRPPGPPGPPPHHAGPPCWARQP
jgi:hypothetical protein